MLQPLYQLRITLLDCKPKVWRRVVVKRSLTLRQLHRTVQAAFGWQDQHLYEFLAGKERYGEPDPEDPDDDLLPASRGRLSSLLRSSGDRLQYVYDFGDDWRHEVLLEDIPPAAEYKHPICLAGAGACPPEDIGGPYSYMEYLTALRATDPAAVKAASLMLGRKFDPERFDVASANRRLKALAPRRR